MLTRRGWQTIATRAGVCSLKYTAALLGSWALAPPAFAQSAPALSPPARPAPDQNGIDLVTNAVSLDTAEISLGDPSGAGIAHNRHWVNSFWLHDYSMYMSTGSYYTVYVTVGKKSHAFTIYPPYPPSNQYADGTTLVQSGTDYLFTDRDGSVITFSKPFSSYAAIYGNGGVTAIGTRIIKPDGEVTNLTYQTGTYLSTPYYRLSSVNNSHGYQLKYEYPVATAGSDAWGRFSKVTAINNAVDYCSPAATTCASLTQPWPTATYSYTPSGSTTYEYAADPMGRVTTYTHTTANGYNYALTGIKNPGNSSNDVSIAYPSSANGYSTVYTGPNGSWKYTNNTGAGTDTVIGPDGNINRTVTYDSYFGAVLSDKNATGQTTSYVNSGYRITQVTRPEGDSDQYVYDPRANVTQLTRVPKPGSGLANVVLSAGYDTTCTNPKTCNEPNWIKDGRGNQTDYTYDATTGLPLTVTAPSDASGARPQTRTTYTSKQAYYKNSAGSIVASGVTQYVPVSVSSCMAASSANPASCVGTSSERVESTDYGPQAAGTANNLLPVSVTTRSGDGSLSQTTTTSYDLYGNAVSEDGPLPGTADTTVAFYNLARQPDGLIGPDPDDGDAAMYEAKRITYDTGGRPYLVEQGRTSAQTAAALAAMTVQGSQITTSDAASRPLSVISKGSDGVAYALAQTSYDTWGRTDCVAMRMNPSLYGALPASACTLGSQGSYGPDQIVHYTYDSVGRTTQVTSGYGTGDAADDQTTTYSGNGQVATVKDAESNLTTYEYDGFDRLIKTRFPVPAKGASSSSTTDYEQVGYDANGNITSFRTRRGETLAQTYDNLDRLTLKVVPERTGLSSTHTRDVYFGYDLLGDRIYARFDSASGEGIGFAYDALGRQLTETQAIDGTTRTVSTGYDLANNRISMTYPDGNYVNYYRYNSGGFYVAYLNASSPLLYPRLNAASELSGLWRWNTSPGAWASATGFGYDNSHRLSALSLDLTGSTNDTTTTVSYNPASQITSQARTNDVYAWPGQVNVGRGYTANGINQYSVVAGTSFGYDTNGNLTYDGTNSYGYDVENRLVTGVVGGASATLRYDPLGRLYEVNGSTTGITRFLYDGDDLIAEYNVSNTVLRRYAHGGAAGDDPQVWFEGPTVYDTARHYLYADERGSIIGITDSNGNLGYINSYDEYGIPADPQALTTKGRFRYTGQAWIPELGMSYYKARMYSPTLGRFMQTDPIGYADGMNMYRYVGNDPVNGVDPSGLDTCIGASCAITVTGSFIIGGLLNVDTLAFAQSTTANVYSNALPAMSPIRQEIRVVGKKIGKSVRKVRSLSSRAMTVSSRAVSRSLYVVHDALFPPACACPGNAYENKQANDAKRQAERQTGLKMTRAQERRFHDNVTGLYLSYQELVDEAVFILNGQW